LLTVAPVWLAAITTVNSLKKSGRVLMISAQSS
jgi:hypothetical protein